MSTSPNFKIPFEQLFPDHPQECMYCGKEPYVACMTNGVFKYSLCLPCHTKEGKANGNLTTRPLSKFDFQSDEEIALNACEEYLQSKSAQKVVEPKKIEQKEDVEL